MGSPLLEIRDLSVDYVTDAAERNKLIPELKGVEDRVRAAMPLLPAARRARGRRA